jgi:hypothetical protein|tara:strand:- start:900 stop:1058 length:159 start_codon:yes stop_codon:yes gene_type:complete
MEESHHLDAGDTGIVGFRRRRNGYIGLFDKKLSPNDNRKTCAVEEFRLVSFN